ncbi:MAG: flagellar basal body-associated FliL family protein [Planctomycetes bacterium]|nr:flagellar basal body-associated FliL family protein [Planctomycetota bacterium]MCB9888050.1 flagellar basal body-associated FliL family protein [Planctomycetota bacterium]
MADDKAKEGAAEDAGKKSGGIMKPLIMVAIGAALGGGGVVMMTKPVEKHGEHEAPQPVMKVVHHPDEMKYVFNPVMERGSTTARIGFKFDYLVEEQNLDRAFQSVKVRWDLAKDRCIDVLTQFKSKELKTAEGKKLLRRRLVDELTMVFFPEELQSDGSKARVAVIENILWTEFFLQN